MNPEEYHELVQADVEFLLLNVFIGIRDVRLKALHVARNSASCSKISPLRLLPVPSLLTGICAAMVHSK